VIDSIIAVTIACMGIRVVTSPAKYDSQIRLQITAPQLDDPALFTSGSRSSSYLRDDLTLVRNNFIAVVRSRQVHERTSQELNLSGPDQFTVEVRPVPDSDFVDLTVSAGSAELARAITNAHAAQAIRYYGELRSKPAASMKEFLDAQITTARTHLAGTTRETALAGDSSAAISAAEVESQQARETYKLLLSKQAEAELTQQQALRATYIQAVEAASPSIHRSHLRTFAGLLLLSLLGSLGFGVICALTLESIFPRKRVATASRDGAHEGSALVVTRG
jgi:uncharacterized protein involved in exopolysaccharide biosynthesis